MYRFALKPKWVLSHLLVVALIAAMIWAGLWQLNRLSERQDQNAQIAARALLAEVDITALLPADGDAGYEVGADLEFLRVAATGTFDRSEEVLVRNRPLNGGPGRWVLTPLVLDDGRAVIVNRGWIPNALKPEDPRPEADPPSGPVTVSGFVRPTEVAVGLQVDDPETGTLDSVARPNIARLNAQTPYDLVPVFIQMEQMEPAAGDLPVPLALPPLEDGPHFSYAMQWFIFTTIALIGYPLILRRLAKGKAASTDETSADETSAGETSADETGERADA